MRKFKKFAAVLLSMVMIVCCFSASAYAGNILNDAKTIKQLETISIINKTNEDKSYYYKINLPDSGKLAFHGERTKSFWGTERFYVSDSNGTSIFDEYLNQSFEQTINIKKKGTYLIKINLDRKYDYYSGGKSGTDYASVSNFYYSFEPDNTPTISLALNVKVGDELDFSALATNYTGKCTWKSTKPAVASVDKGKVKALKVGKAKIRAYMNNGDYAEITLVVKKK